MLALAERLGFGDLNAARNALRSAATPAASSATLSEEWYELDYVARDYPAALAVIGAAPSAMFGKKPRALYEALIYRAQGDAAKARSAFAAARSQLEAKLKNAPDDSELHAALAQVLAGLGDGDAAVSAAKSAVALLPVQHRVLTKPGALVNLASVEARTGHSDDAIQTLGKLMAMPAGTDMSVEDLRINPDWDSIRHDPRFRSLLKRYAQPVSEPAASDVRASAAATGSSDG
jgi:tetratricopeptide (TPR) repeat protein